MTPEACRKAGKEAEAGRAPASGPESSPSGSQPCENAAAHDLLGKLHLLIAFIGKECERDPGFGMRLESFLRGTGRKDRGPDGRAVAEMADRLFAAEGRAAVLESLSGLDVPALTALARKLGIAVGKGKAGTMPPDALRERIAANIESRKRHGSSFMPAPGGQSHEQP